MRVAFVLLNDDNNLLIFWHGAIKSVLLQRRKPGKVLVQPNINMRKSFLYILCFVAVCQLIGCGGGEEQRRQLAELEEQNHSGQPMLNDTLAESLVAYFDRHGNANERMRAITKQPTVRIRRPQIVTI